MAPCAEAAPIPQPNTMGKKEPAAAAPRFSLYDGAGNRKYISARERASLLNIAAKELDRDQWTLILTLAHSGCRLSEALGVWTSHVDLDEQRIAFETLKKRRSGVFRAVPLPEDVLNALNLVHGIREAYAKNKHHPLWSFSRTKAWRLVREAMARAGLHGPHASPKGLRHGFGVFAVQSGVPLNLVQRWLGHAQMTTTAIYADAQGEEETDIAARMWANQH